VPVVAAAVLAIVVLAGCGTSDDTGGAIDVPTTTPPSTAPVVTVPTADLVAAATAACGRGSGGTTLVATLRGSAEAPVPGAPGGVGAAAVVVRGARLGYAIHVGGIDAPTAAHLHEGGAGTAGTPVVMLDAPGADGRATGCASVDAGVAGRLTSAPRGFYVNVHTGRFPDGAVRGQLAPG
jgi:hypothetical protein